jgi:hypothetical protein
MPQTTPRWPLLPNMQTGTQSKDAIYQSYHESQIILVEVAKCKCELILILMWFMIGVKLDKDDMKVRVYVPSYSKAKTSR